MSTQSGIEWTESTWNPLTGCDKISPGCKFCYAERLALRLQAMGVPKYNKGFKLTLHEDALDIPLRWKKPRIVFVNSMSDLFHKDVSLDFIQKVFATMRQAYWHQFQVLTKRAERLAELSKYIDWPLNVWMGVSVENSDYTYRIEFLRKTGAEIKFLSLEPLLGPLSELNLKGIDWIIVGGEAGPNARPVNQEWIIEILQRCQKAGAAFFFKQWGGSNKKNAGRLLLGRTWEEMPGNIQEPKLQTELGLL